MTRGVFRCAPAMAVLIAILVSTAGCDRKENTFVPPPPKVTVSKPVRQEVTDYLEYTGKTQAVNTVQLVARVEGYLEKVLFRDGEIVKKGALLFQIQQDTYRAMLKEAEGNVLAQKARIDHARIELARNSDLYKQKAAAQTDVENWRFQLDSAQAALMAAEAQRALAQLNLGYTSITAPFDGRIDRRLVDPGNLVGPGNAGNTPSATGTAGGTFWHRLHRLIRFTFISMSAKLKFPLCPAYPNGGGDREMTPDTRFTWALPMRTNTLTPGTSILLRQVSVRQRGRCCCVQSSRTRRGKCSPDNMPGCGSPSEKRSQQFSCPRPPSVLIRQDLTFGW